MNAEKINNILGLGINGFFFIFFLLYMSKLGISSWLLEPTDRVNMLVNIGIWYVLLMYCLDKSIKGFDKLFGDKDE